MKAPQREITDQIGTLWRIIIVESKARFIDDAIIRQHDGVVQGSALPAHEPTMLGLRQNPNVLASAISFSNALTEHHTHRSAF